MRRGSVWTAPMKPGTILGATGPRRGCPKSIQLNSGAIRRTGLIFTRTKSSVPTALCTALTSDGVSGPAVGADQKVHCNNTKGSSALRPSTARWSLTTNAVSILRAVVCRPEGTAGVKDLIRTCAHSATELTETTWSGLRMAYVASCGSMQRASRRTARLSLGEGIRYSNSVSRVREEVLALAWPSPRGSVSSVVNAGVALIRFTRHRG